MSKKQEDKKGHFKKGDLLVAEKMGYYGNRRIKPGQVFVVQEEELRPPLWAKAHVEKKAEPEVVNKTDSKVFSKDVI